jgi:hypothetical protein
MKYIYLLIIILITPGTGYSQRLLLGISQSGVHTEDQGNQITQCEYQARCSENYLQYNNSSYYSLEFTPSYFFGGLGYAFSFIPQSEYKFRLLNYPNNSDTLDLKIYTTSVLAGIFYTFGDRDWLSNDISSLRIGFNFASIQRNSYYEYKGKNYKELRSRVDGGGGFIYFDRGRFSLMVRETGHNENIILDDNLIEQYSIERRNIQVRFIEYIFAYAIYF